MSNVDINVDRRTDGRTENRTPISHPATSRCDKNDECLLSMSVNIHRVHLLRHEKICFNMFNAYANYICPNQSALINLSNHCNFFFITNYDRFKVFLIA